MVVPCPLHKLHEHLYIYVYILEESSRWIAGADDTDVRFFLLRSDETELDEDEDECLMLRAGVMTPQSGELSEANNE